MTSIYLAKSNRANPDLVMRVREILSKFDVDIVEFTGGSYSHKQLLGCDMLVVVPELECDEEVDYVPLGKGLHEQIMAFERDGNECDLLIVNYFDEGCGEIGVAALDEIDVCDTDDYVNYSTACLKIEQGMGLGSLTHLLENRVDSKDVDYSRVKNKRKYLLIAAGIK